jgi:DNA polymerase epsilon subunit 2
MATTQESYKLTAIANLLGRSGGSFLLLGLLSIAPTGNLAISDLTGSIALDLQHAQTKPEDGAWFVPGMIALVDGMYEEEFTSSTSLGGAGGVGGTIGGKFIGFTVGGPPCEERRTTLGVSGSSGEEDHIAGGGFGWVDFLGVGSERAVGSKMRKLERRLLRRRRDFEEDDVPGRNRIAIIGEMNLDRPKALDGLKKILGRYDAKPEEELPISFILMGNFVQHAVMAGGGSGGSIEYKEYFDSLASILTEFPNVLQNSTFIFVPGDNDPWPSSFSAGAATAIPRKRVPELFTSRVKRAFATANAEAEKTRGTKTDGEAIWTTNPSRLTLFGPAQEIVLFRDDMAGRLRRTAVRFSPPDEDAEADTSREIPEDVEVEASRDIKDSMDIDTAVEAAESHIPSRVATLSSRNADLHLARKLTKTVLDQGHLSPFPVSTRPVLWDYASALQLYPLPTALVLMDAEAAPFCVTYEECHVMNPGKIVDEGRSRKVRWIEYDARSRKGSLMESLF